MTAITAFLFPLLMPMMSHGSRCLERETVANALTMVQPALLSYGLGGPPQPALLDVASIQVLRVWQFATV